MRIITIGRSSSNDIVVNDPMVTRVCHLKLIQTDDGRFKVIDNSTNGTFVNGHRVQSECYINKGDIIRIGNTTLPWMSYFNEMPRSERRTEFQSVPQAPPVIINQPVQEDEKPNAMAIAGFVCAFFFPLLGIIFSAIGLSQANKSDTKKGRGLAIAGLVISIVFFIFNTIVSIIFNSILGILGLFSLMLV